MLVKIARGVVGVGARNAHIRTSMLRLLVPRRLATNDFSGATEIGIDSPYAGIYIKQKISSWTRAASAAHFQIITKSEKSLKKFAKNTCTFPKEIVY